MRQTYLQLAELCGRLDVWRIQEIIYQNKIEINSVMFNRKEIQLILQTAIDNKHDFFICGEVSKNECVIVITEK